MGILKALFDSASGNLADQWKELITAGNFDELTAVAPGVLKTQVSGRGSNTKGSDGVITNGSKIFIPENTAAYVISQGGIENIITTPGGYEYQEGEDSVFGSKDIIGSLVKQAAGRIGYGGISEMEKKIAFVNLRELRGLKFGTKGPQVYNDSFYGVDLEIKSFGTFSIQITNPEVFVKNFVPANTISYSFSSDNVKSQLLAEFTLSFIIALNSLSEKYRISQLPANAQQIVDTILSNPNNAGTWEQRFGFKIVSVAIENIEWTEDSRELVNKYNEKKMDIKAYEGADKEAADIAARQKMAKGVENNGLGSGGVVLGMDMARGMTGQMVGHGSDVGHVNTSKASIDQQVEDVKKLKELLDAGIITEEEFNMKKKEALGL